MSLYPDWQPILSWAYLTVSFICAAGISIDDGGRVAVPSRQNNMGTVLVLESVVSS